MDLKKLEAFCNIYELKSFSKAGQVLFLSQPTMSAHIASLEEELGVLLFDRVGRGILATQAGVILYHHAKGILDSVERARADIHLLMGQVSGDLHLGGSSIPANYLLPSIFAEFSARYPQVRLRLKVGHTADIIDSVLAGQLVVGIVGALEEQRELTFLPMLQDDLVVIASSRSPYARMSFTSPADIMGLPWVMREEGSGTRKVFEQGLSNLSLDARKLNTVLQVESTGTILQCVQAGIGISIVSKLAASQGLERGDLAVISIPGLSLQRLFYAVRHTQRFFFPAAQKFIEFLGEKFQRETT